MRAFWRNCLAPLIMAAAVMSAGAPTYSAVAAANPSAGLLTAHFCPAGSHWDNISQSCV